MREVVPAKALLSQMLYTCFHHTRFNKGGISVAQSDSETPWTATHQASLSITNSQSLLKFMSIELVMPSNHPLSHPLLSPYKGGK